MVVEPSTGRIPAPDYLDPVLSLEIVSIMVEYFDYNMGESMPLQEWVSLFECFKVVETTKTIVEVDTLTRMMQLDEHVTPHKRRKIYLFIPPEKEDRDPEALQKWLYG